MRIQRLAAAAAATALAASLVGCAEAKDAADKAKSAASDAASSAASQAKEKATDAASKAADKAKEKAKEKAGSLFEDATSKLSPEAQAKVKSLDSVGLGKKGELAQDDDAVLVAEYFGVRQATTADTGADRSALEAISAGQALKDATVYLSVHAGKDIKFAVNVVSSDAGTVNACVGPNGDRPRTLTVEDGKVVKTAPAKFACS